MSTLSPDRVALVAPDWRQARFYARELGLEREENVVKVSLYAHPGTVAGMRFERIILVGTWRDHVNAQTIDLIHWLLRSAAKLTASANDPGVLDLAGAAQAYAAALAYHEGLGA